MTCSVTFSYIVPFHNAGATLSATLDSILKQENILELILVDDASNDDPGAVIQPYLERHKEIRLIRQEHQLGPGLSRNAGARVAKGDILVFVDADIQMPQEAGGILAAYFAGEKTTLLPDAVVARRARESTCKGLIGEYKNAWTSYNLSRMSGWTSFMCSSCVAVRKHAFDSVGGFRAMPNAEDNDLGYRLTASGYRIYCAEDLEVFHAKTFRFFSFLKREFTAGREGIQVVFANRAVKASLREKKFFAVRFNFLLSFPCAFLFSLGLALGLIFSKPQFLGISAGAFLTMLWLNRDFLHYAGCGARWLRDIAYIGLMIPQMCAIGLGMLAGIYTWLAGGMLRMLNSSVFFTGSLWKVFVKGSGAPDQVTFFVTRRCDLDCGHCFVDKADKDKGREVTAAEWESVSMKMQYVPYVTITGGEPFLRDELAEIVRVLNGNLRPRMITLMTNGSMPERIANATKAILGACPGTKILVKVSLDGPPEIHDRMRGRSGAFKNARDTYDRLQKMKRSWPDLSLGLVTTYSSVNAGEVEHFFYDTIAKLQPDQYSLILERPAEANRINEAVQMDAYGAVFSKIHRELFARTRSLSEKFRLAYKMVMLERTKGICRERKYPMRCFAGVVNAVISPEGDVFACEQLNDKLGNLREAGYEWRQMWRSPAAQRIRDFIRQRKCFCTNECFMPFNLVYDPGELWNVLKMFGKMLHLFKGRQALGV